MKNETTSPVLAGSANSDAPISLHNLINRLQIGLLRQSISRRSIVINDVDRSLSISADQDILAFVIGSMMTNAIFSTSDSCIHVEGVAFGGNLHLQVRNDGVLINTSMMYNLDLIANAARKLNGSVSLYNEENSGMTVGLSLVSNKAA